MARLKKPENETPLETKKRQQLELVSNSANRSEKTSWNRKFDNLIKLMAQIEPIEQKILDIIEHEKTPIMDDISVVRLQMVHECIHPFEYLTSDNKIVTCKFCNKRITLLNR